MSAPSSNCIDCGVACTGLRCRTHHGEFLARQALEQTAERDRMILTMVDVEHLSGQRLADRLGISRVRASKVIRLARTREAKRQELVDPEAVRRLP